MAYPKPNVKYLIFISILFIHTRLFSQQQTYWQQEVNYHISVKLNDSTHMLDGFITIEYTNHSPDKLPFLYFHLWPNAYKNDSTALAKQLLQLGKTDFYYADNSHHGYIDSLNFKANNLPIELKYDSLNPDICKLTLNHALAPGEKTTITTPFRVKIPDSFSRMGHIGQSYQISQWYPKPAVYDRDGWHPIPYLDQGEFYSDYGKFDVDITLPKNYVVGASGDLQTPTETAWLDSIAEVTKNIGGYKAKDDTFPNSSKEWKTLKYHLENVHDFAWFADKRYHVLKSSVKMPVTQREVTTWLMFTNANGNFWKNATSYLNDGVYWYSKWIGEYPYNQATAVDGGLSAGGGMEYPTITVIARVNSDHQLEDVIVHEIGHNWFYGILGTNERKHPWMDEGINSFYEYRYLENKYPDRNFQGLPNGLSKFLDLESYRESSILDLAYRFQSLRNEDQPIELDAPKYSSINYAAIVYLKTAQAMRHMKGALGDTVFDKSMHAYFDQWKFKHPFPEDMKATLEKVSGKKLDWFYGDYISTNKRLDYTITKVDRDSADQPAQITVANRGQLTTPFSISALAGGDTILNTIWYDGTDSSTTVTFPAGRADLYRIDAKQEMVEYNRKNDTYRNRGLLHKANRIRFQFIGSIDNPYKNQLYFAPVVGWNNYDKTLVGLAFYNHLVPGKKLEYELVPMVGTGSGSFAFVARAGYTWTPLKTKLKSINFQASGKRFSYLLANDQLHYNKVQPQLTFDFKPKDPRSSFSQKLSFRSVTIFMDEVDYVNTNPDPNVLGTFVKQVNNIHYTVNEAAYTLKSEKALFPYSLNASLQQGNDFVRLFGEARALISYKEGKNKGFNIRLFGGGFLWNNTNSSQAPDPGFRLFYGTGTAQFQKDFLYDDFFFARYGGASPFDQQVIIKDAGFRTPTAIGSSIKNWVISANFTSTLPKSIPLRPYFNVAAFGNKTKSVSTDNVTKNNNIVSEIGIAVVLLPEVLEVNFPLFFAVKQLGNASGPSGIWYVGEKKDNPKNVLLGKKYTQLITFTINISKMNPFALIKNFKL